MSLAHRAKRLLKDLRRRRVFRVAAAYLAVAFVLLQVAEIVFPALDLDRGLTIAVIVAFAGFPVTIVLAWLYDLSPMGVVRTAPLEEDEENEARTAAPEADRRAIAVLPFALVGGDPDDAYFSDGIHEDILTSLSKVSDLRVISRSSVLRYRDESPDLQRLARELGVGAVLEGSVRRAGGQVRISARLVDVARQQNVWAETYDRSLDDIFRIQQDVALQIVRALEAELTDDEARRLAVAPTRDLEAYDLYLRGRYHWNERTERGLRAAVEPLEEAARRDSGFALAHAGLADVHLTRALYALDAPAVAMPRALAAAERALEVDPALGEARAARGCVRALYEWDWPGAMADLEAASRASPGYATAHQWRAAHALAPLGRFEEAHEALSRARSLDPRSPAIHATEAFVLYLERRYDEAEATCRRLLADMPGFALAHQFLGQVLLRKGEPAQAVDALRRSAELRGGTAEVRSALVPALVAIGRLDEARALADEVARDAEDRYVAPTRLAVMALAFGEPEEALRHLEAALEGRAADLVWARSDPAYDPLRDDPAFQEMLGRMSLA